MPWQPLLAAAASVGPSTRGLVSDGSAKPELNADLRQRKTFRRPIRTDVPAKLNTDLRQRKTFRSPIRTDVPAKLNADLRQRGTAQSSAAGLRCTAAPRGSEP
ncbi:MAG: hypothetical protein IMX01_09550 [Limnochordaceae bacterium]|nr:hypothetical protein [Limnochordaceae bacterium]